MSKNYLQRITKVLFLAFVALFAYQAITKAQSYAAWYNSAQQRIDTLRKGNFGITILDKEGQAFSGPVSVRMAKHEFPFGIAFDFYEKPDVMGNSYTTTANVQAATDAEIYKTERWSSYLAYAIPVETGKQYKVTIKLAEIYADVAGARLFDVSIEGLLFLDNYDMFLQAGGKNKAVDTSIIVNATQEFISIELTAVLDNAAIKGIIVDEVGGSNIVRINCGGQALTTLDGNEYVSEDGYFDPNTITPASDEQWMQAAMYKYFNYGVSGNSFKWSGIQPQHTQPDYTNFDNAVRWTQKVGWDLRAHTLLWGGDDAHSMPDWVRQLPTPEAITDTCKMRVQREVAHYKGIIKEYDVINEPLTDHADWLRNTVGDSILWNCFKWAREVDPDAELYINDYNVELNWGQSVEYRDLILKIKEMGGPVTGVGIQAHFWDCCRPNVDEVVKNLNIIAEAGLPMRLTEYDWGTNLTEAQQVNDFMMVATIAFSHPMVNGMISWGLSDKGAWRENTGYFDANHRPKLAADTLLYLTKEKWATNFDSEITNGNALNFNAYYGTYEVEVTIDDTVRVFTVNCLQEFKDSVFVLNAADSKIKGPVLINAELDDETTLRIAFDKPIELNTIKRKDFKFFSNYQIAINEIQQDSENPKELIIALSKAVTKGDYISVSYFPGSLKATDGSIAKAFGPEGIYNPAEIVDTTNRIHSSFATNGSVKVYPNPASDNLNIDCEFEAFKVSVFNIVGAEVYNGFTEAKSLQLDVSQLKKGMYLLKITNSNNESYIQKIVLK